VKKPAVIGSIQYLPSDKNENISRQLKPLADRGKDTNPQEVFQ